MLTGKLYGRGGADDGYAIFGIVTAIKGNSYPFLFLDISLTSHFFLSTFTALQHQNIPHGRLVALIEGCEESGSPDLPFYIEHLKDQIGTPSLIVCLDSGCGTYDQFWSAKEIPLKSFLSDYFSRMTSSLRGLVVGNLRVDILNEGFSTGLPFS